jgi:hypothetical protein
MTAAYRMKGVGWFGGCVAVVLGFYLVSLQVAAERKKLEAVNGQIRVAYRDIRALETEFDTRGNLAQLDVNSLGADGVQTAALLVPSGAGSAVTVPIVPVTAAPAVVKLAPATVAPVQMAQVTAPRAMNVAIQAASRTALKPVVIRASVSAPRSAEAALVRAAKTERLAAVSKVRPQAVAMLDRKLLSDSTLGDIMSGARSESRKRR